MQLLNLIKAVNEKNLTKTQLEDYRDDLSNLYAQMMFELAELEKAEAIYFLESKEETDVAKKRAWRGTEKGQRLIELNRYQKATEKILSSLKSRIYATF